MRIVYGVLVFVVLIAIGFVFCMYLGIYDVSALRPHAAVTKWVLGTTMDNSVRRHSAGISVPPLTDQTMVRNGAAIYDRSCLLCHGAAGIDRSEIGRGLNPLPPELKEAAGDWTPGELFWIAKNGVKMSGMPAFGRSMDDPRLWAVTAFVQRLPQMSEQQYRDLVPQK